MIALTDIKEKVENDIDIDPADKDKFSHYVKKDTILASIVEGKPTVALCGKVWIPISDPKRFPVCPTCKEIYMKMQK